MAGEGKKRVGGKKSFWGFVVKREGKEDRRNIGTEQRGGILCQDMRQPVNPRGGTRKHFP